jgi:hypothetical protein
MLQLEAIDIWVDCDKRWFWPGKKRPHWKLSWARLKTDPNPFNIYSVTARKINPVVINLIIMCK